MERTYRRKFLLWSHVRPCMLVRNIKTARYPSRDRKSYPTKILKT
uniref:Uncharacterized protein n=1 Tax=Meloidogyne enterolobii TaxID=390850 RepID=A0A6V7W8P7_MELEN|nr:unnamed protein product [Meloidogyne enterolobii]